MYEMENYQEQGGNIKKDDPLHLHLQGRGTHKHVVDNATD